MSEIRSSENLNTLTALNAPVWERDEDGNISVTESYKVRAGLGLGLIPSNGVASSNFSNCTLRKARLTTDESRGLDLIELSYEFRKGEEPGEQEFSFDGKEVKIDVTTVEESILNHPKYKDIVAQFSQEELVALKELMNGNAIAADGTENVTILSSYDGVLINKILRGQTHYLAARTTATIIKPGPAGSVNAGKISSNSALPNLPDGESWLCMGDSKTKKMGRTVSQVVYEGGLWDKDIYS